VLRRDEAASLKAQLGAVPEELLLFLKAHPMVGATVELAPVVVGAGDARGEARWMTPDDVVFEATEGALGVAAFAAGLIPLARSVDLGDFYFRALDGAVVLVSRDATDAGDGPGVHAIRVVAGSLAEFRDAGDYRKERQPNGRVLVAAEVAWLRGQLDEVPPALVDFLTHHPVVGAIMELDVDLSDLYGCVKWMSPELMVEEATRFQPGLAARTCGLLPIGACQDGSGDPYFFRARDGAVVRVPHDNVRFADETDDVGTIVADGVDVVATSLAGFRDAGVYDDPEG
jgi:hypothetical protein